MLPWASPMRTGSRLFIEKANGGNSMRLTGFFTAARLGSRHVALGVETALAMTLCLLVLRALTQF